MAEAEQKVEEMSVEERKKLKWIALESSPESLNAFSKRLGLPKQYVWKEIYGFDDALLGFVEKCKAVCFLFGSSKNIGAAKKEQADKIKKMIEEGGSQDLSKNLWYTYQVDGIGNACGSIAAIHSIANLGVELEDGPLKQFMNETKGMDWTARGMHLLKCKDIQKQADVVAKDKSVNQTDAPARDDRVAAHFIAFVHKDGFCYELDGRKEFPVKHAACTEDGFLKAAAKVIREEFMAKDPQSYNFNACALCGPEA